MVETSDVTNNEVATRASHLVAIGASAGGLEAIQNFFDHLDSEPPVAFVVIQHLSPDHKSLLVELLSKRTALPVMEARDGMAVAARTVYVIPPGKMMTIRNRELQLSQKDTGDKSNHAIDIFLESMAEDASDRAIAIILSGTGTDGTKGIAAVHRKGGAIFIQEPETAAFDGMPRSALSVDAPAIIAPPEEMPYELLQLIAAPGYPNFTEDQPDDATLKTIIFILRQSTGCDFNHYKQPTLLRRLARRMSILKLSSLQEYLKYLRERDDEPKMLCKDFLIGVTRFFRDDEAFDLLYRDVLPAILTRQAADEQLKIWVTACSTGEEAYTIAILVDRLLKERKQRMDVKIFATDIDAAALETASKGSYPATVAHHIEPQIFHEYFIVRDDVCQIIPSIRKQIVFAKHDIGNDPPFIKNHLVTCRNMLIYMNASLQKKVLTTLQYSLEPAGYLMLGPTESLGTAGASLEEIDRRWKIFRKRPDATKSSLSFLDSYGGTGYQSRSRTPRPGNAAQKTILDDLRAALMEDFEYAALYVTRNYDIKEAVGAYDSYLTLPGKRLQLNLLKMVSSELAGILTNAIQTVRSTTRPVVMKNLTYREGDTTKLLNISVRPADPVHGNDVVMVILGACSDITKPKRSEADDQQLSAGNKDLLEHNLQLEAEVQTLRGSLQTAVDGLETTNEMLQSTNEELLSSNEELQSSNEELQSLNEELHTLNTEHQLKIQELIQLNDDLNNFFRSTDIGQIFLDRNLRVRKFNRAATEIVSLIDGDIGRPITDIATRLHSSDLSADLQEVMLTGKPIEREIKHTGGKTSIMRLLPYLKQEKESDGIIITFVDTTELKQLDTIIRTVFDATLSNIIAMRAVRSGNRIVDFQIITANKSAAHLLGQNRSEIIGESFRKLMVKQVEEGFFEKYISVVETGRILHNDARMTWNTDSGWYTVMGVKMDDGIVLTFTDIKSRKASEEQMRTQYNELMGAREALRALTNELEEKVRVRTQALSESEERFRLITTGSNDALWDWNITSNTFWWSDSFYNQFGYKDPKTTQSYLFWLSGINPDERDRVRRSLDEAINNGQTQWSAEHSFLKDDGAYAKVLDRAYILKDEYGTPYRILGSMLDVSQLRAAQANAAAYEAYSKKLETVNKELEQSNYALQQFASVASHDLKEPLRKIEVFSGLLGKQIETGIEKDYVTRIQGSSARMTSLIDDLLKYSSLANVPVFEPVELGAVVDQVISDIEVIVREKNVDIIHDGLPTIDAVSGQMRQVFQNLIGNAIKFTAADRHPEIRISCQRVAQKVLDLPEDVTGDFVQVNIADNGIGLEMQYAARIFVIFQRLHNRDTFQGTGIGLAIVKKIMDVHNGLIAVNSEPGKGSTFKLVFPLLQEVDHAEISSISGFPRN